MNLKCEEALLRPSPPSLFKIAAAEFINSRQVRWSYGGTFEEVAEFLIKGTNINQIEFDCDKQSARRILYTYNTLKEILDWEKKEKELPYRPYRGWYRKGGRVGVPNHIVVKLPEEIETVTPAKKYRGCACDIDYKECYCWSHNSVV